ncbi:hypothetical protein NO1_1191 [Candidatus Termititenax aidoneus]|uniref:Uncharacterized protein n=1 Tax=Termititenax aidoneus TaxID=2218524 RepID=A0A388TC16_TERA1|nr:hypothetical protein NO1_1191 [Candidatus Termititenax aidoneus]
MANIAGEKYDGILANNNIIAQDVINALDRKVDVTGNVTIGGTKTFTVSPLVPSKNTTPVSTGTTVIATEAQVYVAADPKANAADVVNLSSAQTISGVKTFTTPPEVPSKETAATNDGTLIATEYQVWKVADDAATEMGRIETGVNTAIAGKADTSAVVDRTSDQEINGTKTFKVSPRVQSAVELPTAQNAGSKKIATEAQVYAASLWQ